MPETSDLDSGALILAPESKRVELPIEVDERIIGFLENDTDAGTIANCALTCRQWLPFSRFKLYYIVVIRNSRQAASFQNTLANPVPPIAGYLSRVQELRVKPEEPQYWLPLEKWTRALLGICSVCLPRLSTIALRDGSWHMHRKTPTLINRSVTKLELIDCTFESIRQMQALLAAFPALTDLSLERTHFSAAFQHKLAYRAPRLTRLRLLDVDDRDTVFNLTMCLMKMRAINRVKHLEWSPHDRMSSHDAGDKAGVELAFLVFVRATLKAGLESLVLHFPIYFDDIRYHLDVLKSLRSLDLRFESIDHLGVPRLLSGRLREISSLEELETVEVHITNTPNKAQSLEDILDMNDSIAELLETTFAEPNFPRLRRVLLRYHNFHVVHQESHGSFERLTAKYQKLLSVIPQPPQLDSDNHSEKEANLIWEIIHSSLPRAISRGVLKIELGIHCLSCKPGQESVKVSMQNISDLKCDRCVPIARPAFDWSSRYNRPLSPSSEIDTHVREQFSSSGSEGDGERDTDSDYSD